MNKKLKNKSERRHLDFKWHNIKTLNAEITMTKCDLIILLMQEGIK